MITCGCLHPIGDYMADKKADKPAEERLFTVPLRKEWLKVPMNKRAKRSVSTIRAHLSRHMKVPETEVKVSAKLNDEIWVRGAGKPPSKIRLKASLDLSSGHLHALLPDEKPPAKEEKKAKPAEEKKPEESTLKGAGKPAAAPTGVESMKEAVEKAADKATTKEAVEKAVKEEKAKKADSEKPEKK